MTSSSTNVFDPQTFEIMTFGPLSVPEAVYTYTPVSFPRINTFLQACTDYGTPRYWACVRRDDEKFLNEQEKKHKGNIRVIMNKWNERSLEVDKHYRTGIEAMKQQITKSKLEELALHTKIKNQEAVIDCLKNELKQQQAKIGNVTELTTRKVQMFQKECTLIKRAMQQQFESDLQDLKTSQLDELDKLHKKYKESAELEKMALTKNFEIKIQSEKLKLAVEQKGMEKSLLDEVETLRNIIKEKEVEHEAIVVSMKKTFDAERTRLESQLQSSINITTVNLSKNFSESDFESNSNAARQSNSKTPGPSSPNNNANGDGIYKDLKTFFYRHPVPRGGPYKCHFHPVTRFSSKNALDKHVQEKHLSTVRFSCASCSLKFAFKSRLIKHQAGIGCKKT